MRMINYAKIDAIVARSLLFFPVFFSVIAFFLLLKDPDTNSLFAVTYCLFAGIILAATPRTLNCRTDSGFLKMLPSKRGDQVKGHFLFSFCCLVISMLLALIILYAARAIRPTLQIAPLYVYLLLLGGALVCCGIELTAYSFFPNSEAQVNNIMRILPGFLFFFGIVLFSDNLPGVVLRFINWITPLKSWLLFLGCFCCYLLLMELSILLENRKDAL